MQQLSQLSLDEPVAGARDNHRSVVEATKGIEDDRLLAIAQWSESRLGREHTSFFQNPRTPQQ